MISGDFNRGGEFSSPDIRAAAFAPEYSGTAYSHRRHTIDPSYAHRLNALQSNTYDARALFSTSLKELGDHSGSIYGHGFDRNSAANKPDGEEQNSRLPLQLDDSDDADEKMKRFYGTINSS